jgi:uncharacterized protein YndB with AHSA1/START domain
VTTTRVARHVRAPRARVYQALLDSALVQQWMVPDGMTSHVHSFDAREGGTFRISLTYGQPSPTGKTTAQTDTFHGRFVRLVPDTEVVQAVEFETDDPALQGEMTITYALAAVWIFLLERHRVTGRRGSLWCIPPLAWLTTKRVPEAACRNSPLGCVAARESALAIPVAR